MQHLVDQLFVRLPGGVPMRFVGQHHESGGTAVATNGLEQLGGLQGCGAGVGIVGTMLREFLVE